MGFDISLSPSKIGTLKGCPRCFFDENVLKIAQPRGIFPSLPGGVDRVMKACLDHYRGSMIPQLRDRLPGVLWGSKQQIDKLRNWRSGLKATFTIKGKVVSLIGALDDLILEPDASYSPFDTKTKGKEPDGDGAQYYLHQLDLYAVLLSENQMRPSLKGYLHYWYPAEFDNGAMQWKDKLYTMSLSVDRGKEWLGKAVDVLTGPRPDPNPDCEYCQFALSHIGVHEHQRRQNAQMAMKMEGANGK